MVAALKAMLEMRWAQGLLRLLTIGSFLLYVALVLGPSSLLETHPTEFIWDIYLGLTALASLLGLYRLLDAKARNLLKGPVRFFLPRGFWKYMFATQQVGLVWFFIQRVDYPLILNFGSLTALGNYVACHDDRDIDPNC